MQEESNEASPLLFWIGIIVCILCVCGFFISSDWIIRTHRETQLRYRGDDSDAAQYLSGMELYLLKAAIWLKDLPFAAKVIGTVIGGWMAISNYDDNVID